MDTKLELFGSIKVFVALQDQEIAIRHIVLIESYSTTPACETRLFKGINTVQSLLFRVNFCIKFQANLLFSFFDRDICIEVELLEAICHLELRHIDVDLCHCARSTDFDLNASSTLSEDLIIAQLVFHFFFEEHTAFCQILQSLITTKLELDNQKVAQLCDRPV